MGSFVVPNLALFRLLVVLVLVSVVASVVLCSLSKSASSLYVPSLLSLLLEFLKVHLKGFTDFLIGLIWAISTKVKRLFVTWIDLRI